MSEYLGFFKKAFVSGVSDSKAGGNLVALSLSVIEQETLGKGLSEWSLVLVNCNSSEVAVREPEVSGTTSSENFQGEPIVLA